MSIYIYIYIYIIYMSTYPKEDYKSSASYNDL